MPLTLIFNRFFGLSDGYCGRQFLGNSTDKGRAYNAIRTDYSTSGPLGSICHELYIPMSLLGRARPLLVSKVCLSLGVLEIKVF